MDTLNKGAFDKLVAGLNSDERLSLLNKINKNTDIELQIESSDLNEKNFSLLSQYRNESSFYKFLLWLRSFFLKISKEKLYNQDLIDRFAKELNNLHPGILRHKQLLLDNYFFERLKSLKDASDFFKPYFVHINENPGDFYVFLSSFVAPEIAEAVNTNADPFVLPFTKEPDIELHNNLIKKMDSILKDMNSSTRNKLYQSVSTVEWLSQFVSLPFIHFISQFTNNSSNRFSCSYRLATMDYDAFASVFSKMFTVQPDVLQSLFLYSQRQNINKTTMSDKNIENALNEFLSKANLSISCIKEFVDSIPIYKLGKIINNNYDWQPKPFEGVESWFASFRNQWKKIIDIRWNDWQRERKKKNLSSSLYKDFGLKEFPTMKYKPWNNLWTRVSFSCELTGGFYSWFVTEKYDEIIEPLNDVAMEGIFIRSENRNEYSEALHDFVTVNTNMKELLERLAPNGSLGSFFYDSSSFPTRMN
ncbi:MAG: hypothetical protein IJ937_03950, partial [Treponema sp.]|nr:hypothetical protein [Treponema sp.]